MCTPLLAIRGDAIHALTEFAQDRDLTVRAILADPVGLGKTWIGTGYLFSVSPPSP